MNDTQQLPAINLLLAFILCFAAAAAADDSQAEVTVRANEVPADGSIEVDGVFNELVWQQAKWFDDFRQSVPVLGAKSSQLTRTAIAFDRENIYVAIDCRESDPEKIFANKLRHRDGVRSDDVVEIILDTYNDQVRGYLFIVNPLGAKDESQINGARSYNWSWDETWEVSTLITDSGWRAEFRIPLRILSFAEQETSTWGINIRRVMQSRQEEVYMAAPPPPFEISSLNYSATLTGLRELRRSGGIMVIPYLLFKGIEDEYGQTEAENDAGLDIKYSISSDLVLDLTTNTDFAQVEADNEQVNLSRYSLFYPEKRDFFLENAQLFNFLGGHRPGRSLMPFFSRRIGIHEGQAVPINMGARLSGKLMGSDIGLLTIQTGEVGELGLDTGLYNVARVRRNLKERSYVGGIFTASDRGDYSSSTFGVDGQWFFSDSTFISGYYTFAGENGIEDDNDAWSLTLDHTTDEFGWALTTNKVGEKYAPDLGFVPRAGIRSYNASIRKSWRMYDHLVRKYSVRLMGNWVETIDGLPESSSTMLQLEAEFEDGGKFNYRLNREYEQLFAAFSLSDELTFNPGEYDYFTHSISYNSSSARRFQVDLDYFQGGYFAGDRQNMGIGFKYILSNHLNVSGTYDVFFIDHGNTSLEWKIFRGWLNYVFNAEMSLSGLFQYNSSTGSYSTNIRFRWIYSNDSELFIVLNDLREQDEFDEIHLMGREAAMKINYRYTL